MMADSLPWLIARSVLTLIVLLTSFAYLMLAERKILGFIQTRLGPNRTGPWGLLQPLADGVKLVLKEDIIPAGADRTVYQLAPIISLFTALAAFAVIPLGEPLRLGSLTIPLSIADPGIGLLFILAMTSLSIYGITLGGWASNSKYALLGAVRAASQMISYELALGMSVLGVLILAETVSLTGIVDAQASRSFIWLQPIGFFIFLVCSVAETNRAPFDLPEAETELVAGYHTEYTGIRFAMFVMAEYVNMLTISLLATLLFLGGWHGPGFLPPVVWLLLKAAALLFFFIWIRATLPRIRYDRLMSFGWKFLLPVSALNLVATAVAVALF